MLRQSSIRGFPLILILGFQILSWTNCKNYFTFGLLPTLPGKGKCGFLSPNNICPWTTLWMSPKETLPESNVKRDLLFIDWDGGCVIDTVQWRIKVAYEAVAQVWPELADKLKTATSAIATATSEQQTSWLTNKLEAIAPTLHENTSTLSATVQYVLATRLLLEEQGLDDGRSSGTGKYGSMYHPRREHRDMTTSSLDANSSGSRPLTVSEVATNWCDHLLDTLPIRYQVRPNQLEATVYQCIDDALHRDQDEFPPINTGVASMLATLARGQACNHDCESGARATAPVVTIRHPNDIQLAKTWIAKHFQGSQIRVETIEGINEVWSSFGDQPTIYLLYKKQDTITRLLEQIRGNDNKQSFGNAYALRSIYVVESSWEALQWETGHNDHPVIVDNDIDLTLLAWCATPAMERRATMCPWSSGCTSAVELEERIGVKVIGFE